jgi:microcystin-dependent protein
MKIVIDGQEVTIPSGEGGGGSGGNPVGTVISFMGTSAPTGYLVCDGAEYEIAAYPALANFFEQQFGTKNHFGGNGTDTFAVPDLRNLFLRGYHGQADEKLSGEIGAKQSGTQHPTVFQAAAGDFQAAIAVINDKKETVPPENVEDYQEKNDSWGRLGFAVNNFAAYNHQPVVGGKSLGKRYTARPANMAVLYCIKATNE